MPWMILGRLLGWIQDFQTVGGWDPEADRTVALPFAGAETWMACWEERPQVCGVIRRDPSCSCGGKTEDSPSLSARHPGGTAPRPIVHGTAAGAAPPPPSTYPT